MIQLLVVQVARNLYLFLVQCDVCEGLVFINDNLLSKKKLKKSNRNKTKQNKIKKAKIMRE